MVSVDRLELAVSHGRISYELLQYFFQVGTDIATTDLDDADFDDGEKDDDDNNKKQEPRHKSDNQPVWLGSVCHEQTF